MYLTREYAPLSKRLEGFLGYARAVPALAAEIRANLRTPLPKAFIERGVAGFGGYAAFFRSEMPAFCRAARPTSKQKRDLTEATAAAARAMDELTLARAQRATATDDFALGAPKFLADAARDRSRRHSARRARAGGPQGSRAQSRRAAGGVRRPMRPRRALAACVDEMRADKPAGGTIEGARAQLAELRQFVLDRKIVTIPNQEQALVAESPPYNRGNFAYISIPGPYEDPAVKVDLLRRSAGCEMERRGAQRLSSRQGLSTVRLGARSVAGPLPAVAVCQRQSVARRRVVVGLRLRRGLGALRRGDDVRRRSRRRRSPRCASAC